MALPPIINTNIPSAESLFPKDGTVESLTKNLERQAGDLMRSVPGVPFGAQPIQPPPIRVVFKDVNGKKLGKDLRAKVRVPGNYFAGIGKKLASLGGVVFPYTPSISYEYKADYTAANPLHTNFSVNFYQRSSIGAISVSGKFTVENGQDAEFYLASLHVLRALTRMRSGGAKQGDPDSGSPPPVCRLDAYGDYILQNVPVVITSVRVELPEGVDYFTYHDSSGNMNSIPTVSTIAINCLPMYSRDEMQKFNVTDYLSNENYRKQGYI